MEKIKKDVINSVISHYATNGGIDIHVQSELLRVYRLSGDKESFDYLREKILENRKNWLNWYTDLQRKWQNTKSINKNYDSFAIRESNIACHVMDDRDFEKRATFYNLKYRKPSLIPSYWSEETKAKYK